MDCDFNKLLSYSLKILSRKDYSVFEIKERLFKRCEDSRIVESVISKLLSIKALDDERFVENFVDVKINRGWGPVRIGYELKKRGIDEALYSPVIEKKYSDKRIRENILKNIKKWLRTKGEITNFKDSKRLFDHLLRLGFDRENILDILKNYENINLE